MAKKIIFDEKLIFDKKNDFGQKNYFCQKMISDKKIDFFCIKNFFIVSFINFQFGFIFANLRSKLFELILF